MRSSVSVLARFGAAAAVAAVAVAGALAPVAASAATKHHAHKAPTHLFAKAHYVKGSHHTSAVINGLLKSRGQGLAGETVGLECRVPKTKFAPVASATTDANGKVSFTVTLTAKRTACKLVFAGDATHRRSHSRVIIFGHHIHHRHHRHHKH
jgi:hypothetical protein